MSSICEIEANLGGRHKNIGTNMNAVVWFGLTTPWLVGPSNFRRRHMPLIVALELARQIKPDKNNPVGDSIDLALYFAHMSICPVFSYAERTHKILGTLL
jgi:hypothetical protein